MLVFKAARKGVNTTSTSYKMFAYTIIDFMGIIHPPFLYLKAMFWRLTLIEEDYVLGDSI
jgi:hypothetical protein